MEELFKSYERSFKALSETEQDELPRSLRLFNIRLRLALDITVDFGGDYSLTRTPIVRETYSLIFRLLEAWNAYEALSHYVKNVSSYISPGNAKSRIYTQTFLEKTGSLSYLKDALEWLRNECSIDGKMKESIRCYLDRIDSDTELKKTIKEDAKSIAEYLNGTKDISGVELLSLIYAERNLYYHNGESAKMGMRYGDRKKLIFKYREILIDSLIRISVFIMNEQHAKSL